MKVVRTVTPAGRDAALQITFSAPVMNVTPVTLVVQRKGDAARDCSAADAVVTGAISSNRAGDLWTFTPRQPLEGAVEYCIAVSGDIYDLSGHTLARTLRTDVTIADSRR